jgi:predicted MFS family arabinose efflux permease
MMPEQSEAGPEALSLSHWVLILGLAAAQLAHVLDFMLVMPLAEKLSADLGIGPGHFGAVVSSYSVAAGVSAVALAWSLDLFDRRHALLFLFSGFTAATLLCAWAPSYAWLMVGRIAAGAFGGVASAVLLAIIGDAIPLSRRGTATGAVFSSFSVATILGIPAGIALSGSDPAGWRWPFLALGLFCAAVLPVLALTVPTLRGHLEGGQRRATLTEVLTVPAHLRAYAFMFVLNLGGWVMMPFLAWFLQRNVGLGDRELQMMYAIGGLAALVGMNFIGRLSDRLPKAVIFQVVCGLALIPLLWLPLLPAGAPLPLVLTVTTMMMVLTSGRGVPAFALLTAVPSGRMRGAFLSLNSAVAQTAMALGPLLASLFLSGEEGKEPLRGYFQVAAVSVAFGIASLFLVRSLGGTESPTPRVVIAPEEAVESTV